MVTRVAAVAGFGSGALTAGRLVVVVVLVELTGEAEGGLTAVVTGGVTLCAGAVLGLESLAVLVFAVGFAAPVPETEDEEGAEELLAAGTTGRVVVTAAGFDCGVKLVAGCGAAVPTTDDGLVERLGDEALDCTGAAVVLDGGLVTDGALVIGCEG